MEFRSSVETGLKPVSTTGDNFMFNPHSLLFDFDGVLCYDRFYRATLEKIYPEVYAWIQENIFGDRQELVGQWMRGKINSAEINHIIAKNTAINGALLERLFVKSVRLMKIDQELRDYIAGLKKRVGKIGLVTDNMDVFSKITVKNHSLNKLFDVIINSADYGYLKKDQKGKLFDIALAKMGEEINNTLLVDDSLKVTNLYQDKGGKAFLYQNFQDFRWFLDNALQGPYITTSI
ncbi:MAG: hypothetical protein PHW01_00745 [Patescibacteria group bacterium]|nr:hypothetical protein [Patescibacteria group bacterium]